MKRATQIVAPVTVLAVIAGFLVWKNWHDRYVWPSPVASMQDLPPLDRGRWPKTPAAWSNETVVVKVATPDGFKPARIAYSVNSIGMKLVRIEPGTFLMGLTPEQERQMNANHVRGHRVTLTRAYYLGACEVINREYELYQPEHSRLRPQFQQGPKSDDHPAAPVTWQDAQKFCRWLSEREDRLYRLPTEAEWEYACKAGTQTRTYWGDDFWNRNMANVGGIREDHETWGEDGWVFSSPVGVYPPNPWGLHDMIGNAWEWVNDWFEDYPAEPQVDPQGPSNRGRYRVGKGGGWSGAIYHVKSCSRDGNNPADLNDIRGFRVLCEAE